MATLPTVPSFPFQSTPSLATLQELAGAAAFVSQMPIVVSLKRNATQSVAANTLTAVQWNVSEVDSDSMHSNVTNPSRLTAQTQGYFRMHACVTVSVPSTQSYGAFFQQTTGSANPLGSGHTQVFGADGSSSPSSGDISLSIRSLTPCLYVGDYVEVYVIASAACTIQWNYEATGHNDTAGNADGGSCLYGYYAFEGP
jgi:hypothetical protein